MRNLAILDADFLLFSCTAGNKVLDSEGDPIREDNKFVYTDKTLEEVFKAADVTISNLLDKCSADYYCGFLGACKSFRKEIYPDYKANRKDFERPRFYRELINYLYDTWKFIGTTDGLEADDAVNIVKNNFKNDYNCIIVSSDKDLIKCIEGTYLNPRDLSIVETDNTEARRSFWKSMITGDPIDNIKGLPGKGIVYANSVIDFCEEKKENYAIEVLDRYIRQFGEEDGIEEFRKNYKCLKILDNFRNFVLPTLRSWELSFTKSSKLDLEGV